MIELFITVRILDIIDILIVSFLMYQFYMLIKGTAAINIFVGIFVVYLIWLIVKALNMELLGSILNQIIGVGMIALIVVFQQEIRRFLLLLGTRYLKQSSFSIEKLFSVKSDLGHAVRIHSVVKACTNLARDKVGAIIVIARQSRLFMYTETGDIINADTSNQLLQNIFFKNSPLHDGAVIIIEDKIYAARCILPISEDLNLPPSMGLRHRAALGITEHTDAIAIIVSEETGMISVSEAGKLSSDIGPSELLHFLRVRFPER
jgi:uncharacterized protein (TIGR00159 family)